MSTFNVGDKVQYRSTKNGAFSILAIKGDYAWVDEPGVPNPFTILLKYLEKVPEKWELGKSYVHKNGTTKYEVVKLLDNGRAVVCWQNYGKVATLGPENRPYYVEAKSV